MKRFVVILTALFMLFTLSTVTSAENSDFVLSENNMSSVSDRLTYLPDQKLFYLNGGGAFSVEIPADGALYLLFEAGGYGKFENGAGSGLNIYIECLDENGESLGGTFPEGILAISSDGGLYRASIGSPELFAGLHESIKKLRVSVTAHDSRQFIRTLEIHSSSTAARDMSVSEWTWSGRIKNLDADTTSTDHRIMVIFICAVALIMIVIRKYRDVIRNRK